MSKQSRFRECSDKQYGKLAQASLASAENKGEAARTFERASGGLVMFDFSLDLTCRAKAASKESTDCLIEASDESLIGNIKTKNSNYDTSLTHSK